MSEEKAKKRRAPARAFTTLEDHEAVDHARWSYGRMRHLARLVLNGETEEAVKMARVLTGKDKSTSRTTVKIEQGEMVLRDGGWVLRFLVESMGEALTNSGAENYLTASFRLGEGCGSYARDLYSVTLQREGKLTPHERMMLAEKERDAALAEVAKARADIATLQGELSRAVAEGATLRRAGREALKRDLAAERAMRPKPLTLDEFEAIVRKSEKPDRDAIIRVIDLARTDRRPVAKATMEALDVLRADAARRGITVDESDRCAPLAAEAPHG